MLYGNADSAITQLKITTTRISPSIKPDQPAVISPGSASSAAAARGLHSSVGTHVSSQLVWLRLIGYQPVAFLHLPIPHANVEQIADVHDEADDTLPSGRGRTGAVRAKLAGARSVVTVPMVREAELIGALAIPEPSSSDPSAKIIVDELFNVNTYRMLAYGIFAERHPQSISHDCQVNGIECSSEAE